MLIDAVTFLLRCAAELLAMAAITRFWMQSLRANAQNPVAQFCMVITNWLVKPLRRIVPAIGKQDSASMIAAFLILMALDFALFALRGIPVLAGWQMVVAITTHVVAQLIRLNVYVFMGAVFIGVLLSWVNPHHPFRTFFDTFSKPLLGPIQKRLPLLGGIDISPMFVLVGLQLILIAPVAWLEKEALQAIMRFAL